MPEPEVLSYAPVDLDNGRKAGIGYWGSILLFAALLAVWQWVLVHHIHFVAHTAVVLGWPSSRLFCEFLIYGLDKGRFSLHIAATAALAVAALARDLRGLAPAIATVLVPVLALPLVSLAGLWIMALRHVPAQSADWETLFFVQLAVYLAAGLMLCAFYHYSRSVAAPVILCVLPPVLAIAVILQVVILDWYDPKQLVRVKRSLFMAFAVAALLWGCIRYFRIPLPRPIAWWLAAVAGMALGQFWLLTAAGPFGYGVSWIPVRDGRELNLPIHVVLLVLDLWFVRQIIRGRRRRRQSFILAGM